MNNLPVSAEEFRKFLKDHELTGAAAAEMVKLKSRQIRRYTGGDAAVPYSVWYTLVHKVTGNAPPDWA